MRGKQDKYKFSAVVLAGGKSSRMGTDKGLMEYKGKAMVLHTIELLSDFIDDIKIGTNNDDYSRFGYPLVKDEYKNCGPIGGLHAALKSAKTQMVLILSCDIPDVQQGTIGKLIELAGKDKIVVAKSERGMEPLCGVYSKTILDDLEKRIMEGNYKLQLLLHDYHARTIYFHDALQFKNINAKEDFV